MPERTGAVTNISPPKEGKKMWSVQIGGKWGRFFGTQYESDEPSEILVQLRDAENRGLNVKATGTEVAIQGSKWPMFKIERVEFVEAPQGAAPAQTFQGSDTSRGRAIEAQTAWKTAATLAASGVIPAELDAISTTAGFIFYGIQELAEGKATGNDANPGEQKAE